MRSVQKNTHLKPKSFKYIVANNFTQAQNLHGHDFPPLRIRSIVTETTLAAYSLTLTPLDLLLRSILGPPESASMQKTTGTSVILLTVEGLQGPCKVTMAGL